MIIDLMKRSSEESANWTGRTLSYFLSSGPVPLSLASKKSPLMATAEAVADRATVEDAERLELLKGAAQQADAEEAVIQWLVDSRRSHDARILLAPY